MTGEKGFTLIETLVATIVFSIAAAAVGMLMTSALAMSDRNKDRAYALSIARSEMEDVHALRYEQADDRVGFVDRFGRRYTVVRTVRRDQPGPHMAEVTVGVTWTGRGALRQTYAAKTIITQVQQ